MTSRGATALERFEAGYIPEPNSGCWIWIKARSGVGYGTFMPPGGKLVLAHRFAYEAFKGPIPDGLHIDHKCRLRCCVNPDHLDAVTIAENNRRALPFIPRRPPKIACPAGHPYAGANLVIDTRGKRICRQCRAEASRRFLMKKRESDHVIGL